MRDGWPAVAARARWKGPYTVLTICVGAYFAVRFAQVIVGPVVPLLIEEFAVSRGAIGTAMTGMWVAYALLQLPSGVLADRYGERRVVLAALGITAGATLALAVAPTFLLFGAAVVGLGVGAGAYYNPATALLTRAFEGFGGAIGTHRSGGQVAGVLAPVAAAVLTVRYGWRPTVAVGGVLVVVVAGLFLFWSTASEPVHPDASLAAVFDPGTFRGVLSRPHTRNTTVLMTLVEFVELAAMAFLPVFLVEHYGFPLGDANLLFAAFFTVSAVSQPLGGWLSDRAGRDATATLQAAAGVAGFGLLAAGATAVAAVPGVALAGVSMSGTPVFQSRMMDGLDAPDRGTGFGVFRTVYLLLGASGTAVVGTVADVAGWGVSFGLLAALFGLVLLSLLALGAAGRADRSLPFVR